MKTRDPKDELSLVIDRAQRFAAQRRERLSTAHFLAALLAEPGHAQATLAGHRATPQALEAVPSIDEPKGLPREVVEAALRMSKTMTAVPPSGLHLLQAMLAERASGAYQALATAGVDIGRLRNTTTQLLLGAPPLRKVVATQPPASGGFAATRPARHSPTTAVAVSLVPRLDAPRPAPQPRAPEPPVEREPPQRFEAETRVEAAAPASRLEPRAERPRAQRKDARTTLDPKLFPVLSSLARNLSAAEESAADEIVGREPEIERCLDVLARRHANSPLLIGSHGVGKTSIVRGVARAMLGAREGSLDDRLLVALDPADLAGGNVGRGAIAERFASIRKELAAAEGRVVLVVEDVHVLFQGVFDDEIGGELRAALAKGELQMIGTSTADDVRRAIETDPQLARRFSPILVEEPSRDEAYDILKAAVLAYAKHHRVRFAPDVMGRCIDWTVRYMPGRALPDKALSVLDLAGARTRRRGADEVGLDEVAGVVEELTDVPASRMLETDRERMLHLEALLGEDVVGHDDKLARVAGILRRNAAGIRGRRPVGSFLLLGPTGVGKTETAKAIARALFHDPNAMTRLDLSEFAEAHSIARLIGAPPGYVGHESGGQLTEAVRKRPYQVILLDEIEKAHRDVLLAFLQVLDEGRMTDGRGRTIDFTSTVVVMTSNLGSEAAVRLVTKSIGFRRTEVREAKLDEAAVVSAARSVLAPELYNRIDEVLVFRPLVVDDVLHIAEKLLAALGAQLEGERGVALRVRDGVTTALVEKGGFDPQLGARPMKRAIAKHIETKLANLLLRGEVDEGDVVDIAVDADGEIVVSAPSGARGAA